MLTTPSGKPRARAIGIPFDGEPGPLNAITDVAGVEVGYRTLIRGSGKRVVGEGPVRTGVTAILPRGRRRRRPAVFAGMFSLNGNGELTGSHWAAETGRCEGPITITNTHSVGLAHDATIRWLVDPVRTHGPVEPAGGRRDLRRLAERHQRLPCHRRGRLRRPGRRARRGRSRRAASAAGPA